MYVDPGKLEGGKNNGNSVCSEKQTQGTILEMEGRIHYFDKHGHELKEGDLVRYESGRTEKLYLTADGQLGTDATNPAWIRSERAVPCEFGIYPLGRESMKEIEKVEHGK